MNKKTRREICFTHKINILLIKRYNNILSLHFFHNFSKCVQVNITELLPFAWDFSEEGNWLFCVNMPLMHCFINYPLV